MINQIEVDSINQIEADSINQIEADSIALSKSIKEFMASLETIAVMEPELHQVIWDSLGDSQRQLQSLRSFCDRQRWLTEAIVLQSVSKW